MSQSEIEIPVEPVSETDRFCATCPELGSCAIIGGRLKLDRWNTDNSAVESSDVDDNERRIKIKNTIELRRHVSELFVNLGEVQVKCVTSMRAGGESLQDEAKALINNHSVAGKYAR